MGERLPTISDMAATVALKQASALSHPALRSCRRWLVELTAISALRRRPSSSFMARKVAFTSFFPGCSGNRTDSSALFIGELYPSIAKRKACMLVSLRWCIAPKAGGG